MLEVREKWSKTISGFWLELLGDSGNIHQDRGKLRRANRGRHGKLSQFTGLKVSVGDERTSSVDY